MSQYTMFCDRNKMKMFLNLLRRSDSPHQETKMCLNSQKDTLHNAPTRAEESAIRTLNGPTYIQVFLKIGPLFQVGGTKDSIISIAAPIPMRTTADRNFKKKETVPTSSQLRSFGCLDGLQLDQHHGVLERTASRAGTSLVRTTGFSASGVYFQPML